jgi:sugar (pentulose or hexulose) kinase
VFQARIVPLAVANSSALGGALRAAQAVAGTPWKDLFGRFSAPDATRAVEPDARTRANYGELATAFEKQVTELVAPPFVKG